VSARARTLALTAALLGLTAFPAAARAGGFGLQPGSLSITAENRDGTIDTQASSHPYALKVHFALNTDGTGKTEGGEMRDAITELPPGLIGNPAAVPACPRQSFEGTLPNCPPGTQVGVLKVILPGLKSEAFGPLYNLVPPPGVAAQLGFSAVGFTALLSAQARSEEGYAVRVEAPDLPLEASSVTATVWGTPADPGHDPERGPTGGLGTDAPLLPFLTLPAQCQAPPEVRVQVDSKLAPGLFVGGEEPMRDKGANPLTLTGCEAVPFSPQVLAAPTSTSADTAAGLGFQLKLPDQGLLNPKEGTVAETEPEKTVVTLPQGITANPAAVNGQGVCTLAQYRSASAASGPGQGCPDSSRLGTLAATTPLLEEAIEGSVYLAAPHENPFNSLLALYIVAAAPGRGVVVKQAGEVTPDPLTGQLTTTIEGLPPIPYSGFEVRLREGPRAPLITPSLCGTYTTTARLYPFSDPTHATVKSAPFTISSGANGGACASSESELPNTPGFAAGSTVPLAASYSPFTTKLTRADGTQHFKSLNLTLPPGVTAKLAGTEECSDAQIAAASARSREGDGALEVQNPSCPANSLVGVVNVGAGAGPTPYYVQGKAYLAGPYKGAPVSLAIVTPAIAGPFDLGNVVVRAALHINEETAQVTVTSDDVPQILFGIPLAVRSIGVQIDRNQFTLNPTNCEPMAIGAVLTSAAAQLTSLSQRFQVGGCNALGFKPRLALKLKGSTKRGGHPALTAVLKARAGDANIARAQVTLPRSEFLDQGHLNNICTRVQFKAGGCPAASVYGYAKAVTPLFDQPLEGPVYLRSNPNHNLPDIVAALKGPASLPVEVDLAGRVDSVVTRLPNGEKVGRIRNTFEVVPDAPVSEFTLSMQGGKKGLLENSEDLCARVFKAKALFSGQNGRRETLRPVMGAKCTAHGRTHKRKARPKH
jgi:hypothetical protein